MEIGLIKWTSNIFEFSTSHSAANHLNHNPNQMWPPGYAPVPAGYPDQGAGYPQYPPQGGYGQPGKSVGHCSRDHIKGV